MQVKEWEALAARGTTFFPGILQAQVQLLEILQAGFWVLQWNFLFFFKWKGNWFSIDIDY